MSRRWTGSSGSAVSCSNRHVLFDIVPDDLATPARLADYRQVFKVSAGDGEGEGERAAANLAGMDVSRFEAPRTVRVSASRPAAGAELTVHFVNYDRTEPREKRSAGSGIVDERPRSVSGIQADLRLPPGTRATSVVVLSPEYPGPRDVRFEPAQGRVGFTVPEFLVSDLLICGSSSLRGCEAYPLAGMRFGRFSSETRRVRGGKWKWYLL